MRPRRRHWLRRRVRLLTASCSNDRQTSHSAFLAPLPAAVQPHLWSNPSKVPVMDMKAVHLQMFWRELRAMPFAKCCHPCASLSPDNTLHKWLAYVRLLPLWT